MYPFEDSSHDSFLYIYIHFQIFIFLFQGIQVILFLIILHDLGNLVYIFATSLQLIFYKYFESIFYLRNFTNTLRTWFR